MFYHFFFNFRGIDQLKMARSIDWARLGWCMTQNVKVGTHGTSVFANGKSRFAQFKAVSDQVMGKHSAASSRPTSINFAAYKAALPEAQQAWVESMEKTFNETVVPAPVDNLSAAVEAEDSQYEEMESATEVVGIFSSFCRIFCRFFCLSLGNRDFSDGNRENRVKSIPFLIKKMKKMGF